MAIEAGDTGEKLRLARDRLLADAIEQLAGAGAPEEVIAIVRTNARRMVGADGITIVLREDDHCHYIEEDAISPLWKGQRFPAESCISGWSMIHRQTAVIPDIFEDDRIPQALYRETFVRSLVMVPVGQPEPIGAIGAYWSDAQPPSSEAVALLERLARATGAVMQNMRLVGTLSRALAEAELARDELRHRVKNAFAAAQALAVLTLPAKHAETLSDRITALARAHDLLDQQLSKHEWIGLDELVAAELDPYRQQGVERIVMSGPSVECSGREGTALGLVLNELATNALKYGALSTRSGKVEVSWRVEGDHLILEWRESDGPEVKAATIESFGSRLLKRLVEGQLGGTIRRQLAPTGAVCVIDIPAGDRGLP